MSILSPAKKERIERHLMRQRGAGTRTISGTFGFAFGSSAPTSHEATPTSLEPAAKRRKTRLASEIGATDESVKLDKPIRRGDIIRNVKGARSKKRWAPELDVESIARSYPEAEDDSFIRTAKSKLKKQSNREASKQHVDADCVRPAARGRPRRQAAAKAAVKVADDLQEQRLPIDKKRRTMQLDAKLARSNRERQKQDGPTEVIPASTGTFDVSKTKASSKEKKAAAKSSVQRAIKEPRSPQAPRAKELYNEEGEEGTEPATRIRKSRKRKQREDAAEPAADVQLEVTRHRKRTKTEDSHADVMLASKTTVQPLAPNRIKKTSGTPVAAQINGAKGEQQSLREPLKESDANVTLRSTSPQKFGSKKQNTDSLDVKARDTSGLAKGVEQENRRPAKRRKTQVRQDNEVLEGPNKETEAPGDFVQINSRSDVKTTTKRVEQTNAATSTISTGSAITTSKRKNRQEHPTTALKPIAQEEDIDWLFQSLPTKQQPPVPRKRPAPSREGPRTPRKLVDIDLDDLLSNIASFATTENQANGTSGPTVQLNATKTANGVHSKRKC